MRTEKMVLKSENPYISQGANIINEETGQKLTDFAPVRSIQLNKMGVEPDDQLLTATVEIILEKVEVAVGEIRYVCWHPDINLPEPVKLIEFADGSRYEFDVDAAFPTKIVGPVPKVGSGEVDVTGLSSPARVFALTLAKEDGGTLDQSCDEEDAAD